MRFHSRAVLCCGMASNMQNVMAVSLVLGSGAFHGSWKLPHMCDVCAPINVCVFCVRGLVGLSASMRTMNKYKWVHEYEISVAFTSTKNHIQLVHSSGYLDAL